MTRRRALIVGVALALVVVMVFGSRAAWRLGHRLFGPPPPPRQTDVALIADWMSVPYISRAYHVPEPELYRALGVEREGRRMRHLHDIAEETGRTPEETVALVRETVQMWQEAHPGPPTPPGASPPPLPPPRPKDGVPRSPGGQLSPRNGPMANRTAAP